MADNEKKELTRNDIQVILNQELGDFKKFAFQSSMIQTAVAFIMGVAFKNVVTALSEDLIMPFVNFAINKTGVNWRTLTLHVCNGITLDIGKFCGSFVDFMITAIILYFIYKHIVGAKIDAQPGTKN